MHSVFLRYLERLVACGCCVIFFKFFYFFNFLRSLERLVACGCFAWKVNAGLGFRVYGLGAVERLTR
jgi:hypothetical protein